MKILILIAILIASTQVKAVFFTAGELITANKTDTKLVTGYMMGIFDAIQESKVCLYEDLTFRLVRSAINSYMTDNKHLWKYSARSVIKDAIIFNYGCNFNDRKRIQKNNKL